MQIVFASNTGVSRDRARAYIARCRAENSRFSVVDVGGAADPWSGADCFVDFHPVKGRETITGDIHDPAIWREIAAHRFDFCVCSHTLEDIRDPLFVLGKIRETFSQGYIAVPNKHVEFGHIESRHYVGYGHHRWIYTLVGDDLRVVAKLPLASYFSPHRAIILNMRSSSTMNAVRRAVGAKPHMRDAGPLRWRNPALGTPGNELAFIWNGSLNFRAINADYSGASTHELAQLYREGLADGI